jgi:hypothetical protein
MQGHPLTKNKNRERSPLYLEWVTYQNNRVRAWRESLENYPHQAMIAGERAERRNSQALEELLEEASGGGMCFLDLIDELYKGNSSGSWSTRSTPSSSPCSSFHDRESAVAAENSVSQAMPEKLTRTHSKKSSKYHALLCRLGKCFNPC